VQFSSFKNSVNVFRSRGLAFSTKNVLFFILFGRQVRLSGLFRYRINSNTMTLIWRTPWTGYRPILSPLGFTKTPKCFAQIDGLPVEIRTVSFHSLPNSFLSLILSWDSPADKISLKNQERYWYCCLVTLPGELHTRESCTPLTYWSFPRRSFISIIVYHHR
jgi:hypothetical protein